MLHYRNHRDKIASCTDQTHHAHHANQLYQHGTLALLVPGLLEGTTTIGELLTHGDTGIGTGEGSTASSSSSTASL